MGLCSVDDPCASRICRHGAPRKRYKYRSGTVALREAIDLQLSTQLLIRKTPFQRLTREIVNSVHYPLRIASRALEAFQEACETHITSVFTDANEFVAHGKRKTLQKRDIDLALRLRRER
ncbi:Oidioi.mRNA.OKI2018_I69.PAR.g11993.t1.cds [Oikopleura dioica]|uniref:Oidioi.mRNA.OKI2018_I69.PAR.g11993.t1.cds n=1 Tax=Oikopleura dioica TaxID=34765 RepID=A0ABN7RY96_OIKDI|nr:Oidioi.mRNA.OKI2018_I69.PAR.g11993.t1.cds [Oikopleura dioica]